MISAFAIAITLCVWGVLYLAFCGWGAALVRLVLPRPWGAASVSNTTHFWLGVSVVTTVIQLWHSAFRIDWKFGLLFLAVGFFGALPLLRRTRRWARALSRFPVALTFFLGACLFVASRSTLVPNVFDSGLYHFSSIRWSSEYPIVPGLGNLHGRLAFNQSYFLLVSLIDALVGWGRGFHFLNGLFCMAVLQMCGRAGQRLLSRTRTASPSDLFLAASLPFLVLNISALVSPNVLSSPTPDIAIFIVGLVVMHRFIQVLFETKRPPAARSLDLLFIVCIATCEVTMKLSAVVAALLFVALTAIVTWQVKLPGFARAKWLAFAFAVVTATIWCSRGVVLSGYPLYPSSFGGFPVDWKIPLSSVQRMHDAIVGFAREPSAKWPTALHNYRWFPIWASRVYSMPAVQIWIETLVAGSLVFLGGYFQNGRTLPWGRSSFIPLIPVAASMVFWFVMAPDPRFAGSLPWAGACWLGVLGLRYWPKSSRKLFPVACAISAVFVSISPFHAFEKTLDEFGLARIPSVEVQKSVTASGLEVWIPVEGWQVWDCKLPNAPTPVRPWLRMRGTGLKQGFRIEPVPDGRGGFLPEPELGPAEI